MSTYRLSIRSQDDKVVSAIGNYHTDVNLFKKGTYETYGPFASGQLNAIIPVTIQFFKKGNIEKIDQIPLKVSYSNAGSDNQLGLNQRLFSRNNGHHYQKLYASGVFFFFDQFKKTKTHGEQLISTQNINIKPDAPVETQLGSPIDTNLVFLDAPSLPAEFSYVPAALSKISQGYYLTDVKGISYSLSVSSNNSSHFFDADSSGSRYDWSDSAGPGTYDAKNKQLSVRVRLQFFKTGDINPSSRISAIKDMGRFSYFTRENGKRVLYQSELPLSFRGNISINSPGLGCEG